MQEGQVGSVGRDSAVCTSSVAKPTQLAKMVRFAATRAETERNRRCVRGATDTGGDLRGYGTLAYPKTRPPGARATPETGTLHHWELSSR